MPVANAPNALTATMSRIAPSTGFTPYADLVYHTQYKVRGGRWQLCAPIRLAAGKRQGKGARL